MLPVELGRQRDRQTVGDEENPPVTISPGPDRFIRLGSAGTPADATDPRRDRQIGLAALSGLSEPLVTLSEKIGVRPLVFSRWSSQRRSVDSLQRMQEGGPVSLVANVLATFAPRKVGQKRERGIAEFFIFLVGLWHGVSIARSPDSAQMEGALLRALESRRAASARC